MITFIPSSAGEYQCMASDIINNSASSIANYIGADLYVLDLGAWFRIGDNLQLYPIYTSSSIVVTNFPASQLISGSVGVTNFPTSFIVSGSVASTDNGPTWTDSHGVSNVPYTSASPIIASGSPVNVTDAPASGKKLVITDLLVSSTTANNVVFVDESTAGLVTVPIVFNTPGTIQLTPRGKPWKLASANKHLQMYDTATGIVYVDAVYHSEA
jgi:hypothetical protein